MNSKLDNNGNIPSINQLHRERESKQQVINNIFKIVLGQCIQKIMYANRFSDKTFIYFEVPKFLIGQPTYDYKNCILFLMKTLSESNYKVEFIDPYYIHIDWGSVPQEPKKKHGSETKIYVFEEPSKPKKKVKRKK